LCWIADSKWPLLPFFRCFTRKWCNWRKKYGHIFHQRLKMNTKYYFVFRFFANFHFNGLFHDFGRPYWIEDINGKCGFAIPYKVIRWKTWYASLKKIGQKSKTLECRKQKSSKNRYDVIKLKLTIKWSKRLFKILLRSLVWILIKIVQTVWLEIAVTDTQTLTDRN